MVHINIAKSYALRRSTSRKYPYNKIKNKYKNDPVIIKINAIEAFNNKVIFTKKNNEVWVSKFVDKRYLEVINL
jgi:RNA:NAD 2'-phosphotransferase (TPT1/KptA family)